MSFLLHRAILVCVRSCCWSLHSAFARLTFVRRPVQPTRRYGEHLATCLGYAHGVLELRGQGPVARDRRPAVRQYLHMRLAEIDHRLNGEQHAGLERQSFARLAVMQNVRPVVERATEAMATEVTHYAAALAFGVDLDRRTDIPGGCAGLDGSDASHQSVIGDFEQAFGRTRDLAHTIHAARIAMPA